MPSPDLPLWSLWLVQQQLAASHTSPEHVDGEAKFALRATGAIPWADHFRNCLWIVVLVQKQGIVTWNAKPLMYKKNLLYDDITNISSITYFQSSCILSNYHCNLQYIYCSFPQSSGNVFWYSDWVMYMYFITHCKHCIRWKVGIEGHKVVLRSRQHCIHGCQLPISCLRRDKLTEYSVLGSLYVESRQPHQTCPTHAYIAFYWANTYSHACCSGH